MRPGLTGPAGTFCCAARRGLSCSTRNRIGSLGVAREWVMALDHSVLPIQGPPGAGKTYTGARMITALVRAGYKVGITALSHKVIRNILEAVVDAAEGERTPVRCIQKVDEWSEQPHPAIVEVKKNEPPLDALQAGEADVVAGTAWLWARPEYRGRRCAGRRRGRANVARRRASGRAGCEERRPAGRSPATQAAPARQPSRRDRRVGAGASPRRA